MFPHCPGPAATPGRLRPWRPDRTAITLGLGARVRRGIPRQAWHFAACVAAGLLASPARAEVYVPPGLKAYQRGDYATALATWRPLAEAGDPTSQYFLGLLYDKGKGVLQDTVTANRWYEKAAEGGYEHAQYIIAWRYHQGEGVPRDLQRAVYWFRVSGERGYRGSQFWLGALYARGDGVPVDPVEAGKWYRAAAEQGDTESMYRLGALYFDGALPDLSQAEHWFRVAAAAQGHRDATFALGRMYLTGRGVPQDEVHALAWFALSARQGRDEAVKEADALLAELSPEAVVQADHLYRAWRGDRTIFTPHGGYTQHFSQGIQRNGCKRRLGQLIAALARYAREHDGHYPERLGNLYPTYVTDLTMFRCPSDSRGAWRSQDIDAKGSYLYLRPRASSGYDVEAKLVLVLRDKDHLPHQYGMYLDRHIEVHTPPSSEPPTAVP